MLVPTPQPYFASWADSLRAIAGRDRPFTDSLFLQGAAVVLAHQGYEAPPWADLLTAPLRPDELSQEEPADFGRGWQRAASKALSSGRPRGCTQGGPFAGRVFHRPPHQPRSPLGLRGIPSAPPASTAFAASTRLSHLPVRSTPRLSWRSPGRLPPRWTFALPVRAFGASSCQSLPRGRSHCCSQCFAPQPQCHRAAPR